MLSYTALLLPELVKTGNIRENEDLPPVFPIVIYNGNKAWKAPQEVAALFAPMPESLKFYCPRHRDFLLDESRVSGDELDKSKGLVAQLLRLERAQEPKQVRQIVKELISRLHGPEYLVLRRAFTIWLARVVLKRSGITEKNSKFQDLREVDAMLEERAAQWKDEYIRQGAMIGKAEGKTEGIGLALRDLLEARFGMLPKSVTSYIANSSDSDALRKLTLSAYHTESLQAFIDQIKKDEDYN